MISASASWNGRKVSENEPVDAVYAAILTCMENGQGKGKAGHICLALYRIILAIS